MKKRNKHIGSDPGNVSVTLQTLTRTAHAVGRDLRIELV
jgi:hypothetical protein